LIAVGAWLLCIVLIYELLSALDYPLRDADSTLYEAISRSLKDQPFSHWATPLWPAGRAKQGLFVEHLPFFFWPAGLLYRIGLNQAALLMNLVYFFLSLYVLFLLATRLSGQGPGWLTVFLYLVSPLGVQYLLRFNHENAWTVGFLGALYCVTELPRGRAFGIGLVLSLSFVFAIKGILGLIVFPVALTWWWLGERRSGDLLFFLAALGAVLLIAASQETAFRRLTGENFFQSYLSTQLEYVAGAERLGPWRRLWNPLYNVGNLIWFALPGSLLAAYGAYLSWQKGIRYRGTRLVGGSGGVHILLVSIMTRRAARYIFPLYSLTQLVGAEILWNRFPEVRQLIEKHRRQLPYLLAAVVLVVFGLRLYADFHHYRFINIF
jgi:hypothetical protein